MLIAEKITDLAIAGKTEEPETGDVFISPSPLDLDRYREALKRFKSASSLREFPRDYIETRDVLASALDFGMSILGQKSIDALRDAVRRGVEACAAVDQSPSKNLTSTDLFATFDGEMLKRVSEIHWSQVTLLGRNSTVLLLDDRATRDSDIQLQSIAHGVLILEQLAPLYGAERRRMRIIKYRGVQYRGGYHDFRIRPGGLEVFPRIVAGEHSAEFEQTPVGSGISQLDALLGGGLDRGTSTLLVGPAGSGKSTIGLQYALAAAERGEHAVVFAFDESLNTMNKRLSGLGMNFEAGNAGGQVKVQQMDPAEVSPGEFGQKVRHAVERDNASLIVIDSLNGYLNAMPEESFLIIQLHELLSYLARRGVVTIMVVAQHGMVDSTMQTPVDTSYLADSVLLFRYFEDEGRVKKAMSVIKKRSGAHEETIRELSFNQNGINLSEPLSRYRGVLAGVPVMLKGRDEK